MTIDGMDVDQDVPESHSESSLKSLVAETCCLQDYIQGFTGYVKAKRLLFIAEQCSGSEFALDALRMAHDELKEHTLDTDLYKTVIDSMQGRAGDAYNEDNEWIEQCESRYFALQADLENRLVTAKSALDHRQIAALEKEYGDLLCRKGLFAEGMKHYLRIREYSKDPDDVLCMLESASICAFHMKNYFAVMNHSRKVELFQNSHENSDMVGRARLVSALTQIAMGRFEVAAKMASTMNHHAMVSSPDIVSSSSFALCMVLCALASLSRDELEALGSMQGFQALLNLAPQKARDALQAKRHARHGHVLILLEELRPFVWIDLVLYPHMVSLYEMIQDRCLCEYSSAFSRISLQNMAEKFGLQQRELEKRLSHLIQTGALHARIDAQAHQLLLKSSSVRNEAFQTAIQTAQTFIRDSAYALIGSQMVRGGLTRQSSMDPEEHSRPATLDGEDLRTAGSTQETASVKILDNDEGDPRDSKHRPISHAKEQFNVVKDSVGNEAARDGRLTAEYNNLPEGRGEPKVVSGVGKREEWMEHPQAAWENSYSRQDVKRQETQPQESKGEVSTRYIAPSANRGSNTPFSVGDGGASWRMKALKRAHVQAQVEGTSLTDVVQQRWGSVSELAASAERAAPMDAHQRSKKSRRNDRGAFMKGNMRRPKTGRSHESDRGGDKREYDNLVKHAARHMNAFKDDGSFADQFKTSYREEKSEKKVESSSGREPKHRDHETSQIEPRSEEPPVSQPEDRGRDNTSVAAMIRARLSGNRVHESLQKREGTDVILPMIDARGKAAPGAFGRETAVQAHGNRDHKKKLDRYQDGKKSRYFADDDDVDLDTMLKRSKHGDEEEMDAVIARNIVKRTHFKGNEFNVDDEYEFDAGLDFLESSKISKKGRQRGREKEELARKEKAKQVREYKSMSRALERCRLCLSSQTRKKHLMVSVGTCAYLALPEKGRLVTGHCCVVPTEHIPSARAADENTWEEMRNFKKCVLQMFSDRGKHCIFIETVLDVDPLSRSHAIVECIPVSESVAAKAPMYFKKAIDDATNDWSQHAAKTCIETESRHLQKKIPANFPYVHIEFGLAAGFVHVIDNPKEFDPLFARRVLVGLMGLPEEDMHGRLSKEGETVQHQWVDEFQKAYTAYDWVPQLHQT